MKNKFLFIFILSFIVIKCQAQQWYSLNHGLIGSGQYDRVNALCTDSIYNILFAGGSFQTNYYGDTLNNLSFWDGSIWKRLNFYQNTYIGVGREVSCLLMFHGKLIMGWNDATSSNSTWNSVTEINIDSITQNEINIDTSMDNLFGRFNDDVNALYIYSDTLYVAGAFTSYKNHGTGPWLPMYHIAKWNGSSFQQVGGGIGGTEVNALGEWNNKLIAGGLFASAGGIYCKNIASWDGISWDSLGSGIGVQWDFSEYILSVCSYHGKLYAGGGDINIGSGTDLVCWDGTSWSSVNANFVTVKALKVFNNRLYAGAGTFYISLPDPNFLWHFVAEFNDTSWSYTGLGPGMASTPVICDLAVFNNQLIAGGVFTGIGYPTVYCGFVAQYNPASLPEINISTSNLSCHGICNGSATANILANGIPPFSYQWSIGETTQIIDSLCVGSYIVVVTDSTGMYVRDTIVIMQPTQLLITDTSENASCSTCNNGTATANASGGTPPFTYNWSTGATTQTADSLTAGTYYVTVTDDNGCEKIDTVVVDFNIGINPFTTNNFQYTIYPNPATDELTIQPNLSFNNCKIEITNTIGVKISSQEIKSPTTQLNIKSLPIGIYFIKLKMQNGETQIKKFVKQ